MKHKLSHLGIFCAFGLLIVACCTQATKRIVSRQLKIPEYETVKNFSLSVADGPRTFSGQILIWNPDATKDGVENVLRLKRRSNEAMVLRRRNLDAYINTVLEPAVKHLEAKILEKDVAERNARIKTRTASMSKAETWFDSQSAQNLSPDFSEYAKSIFSKYCESKLYSFATSAVLASQNFTARPTPSAICEAEYRKLGLFSSQHCTSNEKGANYFNCIWQDGVLKSSFANRYTNTQRENLNTIALSPNFLRIFQGSIDADCSLVKIRGNNRIRTSATLDTIVNHILSGTKSQEFTCNGVQGSFSFADLSGDSNSLAQASPAKVFGDLESRNSECDSASLICFVPDAVSGNVATPAYKAWGSSMSRKLVSFSASSLSCEPSDRASWFTRNFVTFNSPLLSSPQNRTTCNEPAESDLPEIFVHDDDPSAQNLKLEVSRLRKDFLTKKMKACLSFDPACDPNSSWNKDWEIEKQTASDAGNAALAKGIAITVVPGFSVTTERTSNGSTIVSVALESTKAKGNWSTCLSSEELSNCPTPNSPSDAQLLRAAFDNKSGILTLDLPIGDLRLFAHEAYEDTPEKLHPLVAKTFTNTTLHVELVPAVMGNLLPYLSGKVTIRDNSHDLYQGVSYVLDTSLTKKHENIFFRF